MYVTPARTSLYDAMTAERVHSERWYGNIGQVPSGEAGKDWYRSERWDLATAAYFEERLCRARPEGRPQYLRIQATHLLHARETRESGRALLRRVIDDYPEDAQARTASEQLGDSLGDDGRLAELRSRSAGSP